MAASSLGLRVPVRRPGGLAPTLGLLLGPALVGALSVRSNEAGRLVVGVVLLLGFFLVSVNARDLALTSVLVWLAFLGFFRRALIPFVGWPAFDPLLLVGPACAVILWVTARGGPLRRTLPATLAMILFGIATAQVMNPGNGEVLAGVLGSLFWLGPLLWFFVGRTLEDRQMERVMRLVAILLVPVTLHGLSQSYGRFLPFEYTWVGVSGFGESLFLQGFKIRPFSTLVSPQEYGYFLMFGLTVLWTGILGERAGRAWKLPLFAVSTFALFLQGGRTTFAFFLVMLLVTASLRMRLAGARLVVVALVGLLVAFGSTYATRPGQRAPALLPPGSSSATILAQHQITGFTDPEASTLPIHRRLIADGFRTAWERPLGTGLAQQSLAERKVTGVARTSTENDVAAAFVALGMLAGILFVTLMGASFVRAFRRYRLRPTATSLAAAGLLVAFLTQWWSGAMYATSSLFWLVLGWLARPEEEEARAA